MAFKTDKWIGGTSADWGASSANWSAGFPNSNSNVVISTPTVLTVTYGGSDNFTVHSLAVGKDFFDLEGSTLAITTTASFADGFTQTGGVLSAGGKVTVDGTGTLTGGGAEGHTAFFFDGTVALANYTLGGATVLSNAKTTNMTGTVTLGDSTGVNAKIINEKGGVFNIAGDFDIEQGAATAKFINDGSLEQASGTGTSIIAVDFTDTGSIVVGTAATIEFDGPVNSFAGPISGAGQFALVGGEYAIGHGTTISAGAFTIANSNTVVTLDEGLSYMHAFTLEGSAALDLAGSNLTLTLSGTNILGTSATIEGTGTLVTAKGSSTTVNGFFVGGGGVWQNSGIVGEVNFLQLGDTTFNPATFINEKGGVYQFASDVGIATGDALNSSFVNDAGATLEKTSGDRTSGSIVSVDVTDNGTIVVKTDILDFTGVTNSFAGKISGAGQFAIGGGEDAIENGAAITTAIFGIYNNNTFVTLDENLTYAGTFNLENGALLTLGGVDLTLSGNDTFANEIVIDGTGTLLTASGSTVGLSAFTLGGGVAWQNSGTVNELNFFQLGDGSFDFATFTNEKGGVFDFAVDDGISSGGVPGSSSSTLPAAWSRRRARATARSPSISSITGWSRSRPAPSSSRPPSAALAALPSTRARYPNSMGAWPKARPSISPPRPAAFCCSSTARGSMRRSRASAAPTRSNSGTSISTAVRSARATKAMRRKGC